MSQLPLKSNNSVIDIKKSSNVNIVKNNNNNNNKNSNQASHSSSSSSNSNLNSKSSGQQKGSTKNNENVSSQQIKIKIKQSSSKGKKEGRGEEEEDEQEQQQDEEQEDSGQDLKSEDENGEEYFENDSDLEEEEEEDIIGDRSVCLACTRETPDLKLMFINVRETDEKKREKILCEFCYHWLHMSFELPGICSGEHREKEFEGVFLAPDKALKRQDDRERAVTFEEVKKTKRLCFDCIQDVIPWNTRQIKILRRAYKRIKTVSLICGLCSASSVTVKHAGSQLRLCELCIEDLQNAKNDPVMCLQCRKNTAVISKGLAPRGEVRDQCYECIEKNRLKAKKEESIAHRKACGLDIKDKNVITKIENENNSFLIILGAYINNLQTVVKAARKKQAKKKETDSKPTKTTPNNKKAVSKNNSKSQKEGAGQQEEEENEDMELEEGETEDSQEEKSNNKKGKVNSKNSSSSSLSNSSSSKKLVLASTKATIKQPSTNNKIKSSSSSSSSTKKQHQKRHEEEEEEEEPGQED